MREEINKNWEALRFRNWEEEDSSMKLREQNILREETVDMQHETQGPTETFVAFYCPTLYTTFIRLQNWKFQNY